MRRLFAEPARCKGDQIELDEAESRHAAQVLRARVGERFEVMDGAGGIYDCAVQRVEKKAVHLQVAQVRRVPRPEQSVELFQAVAKGKVMDWIVQKATELGVARVAPVLTERTVVEIGADSAKVAKWRAIAIESIKQCGAPFLPEIENPVPFAKAVRRVRGLALVAALHPDAGEIDEFLAGASPRVQIWVGPEGDFTPGELAELMVAGARPITLGPLALRCDTAAVCALSLAQHHLRVAMRAGKGLA